MACPVQYRPAVHCPPAWHLHGNFRFPRTRPVISLSPHHHAPFNTLVQVLDPHWPCTPPRVRGHVTGCLIAPREKIDLLWSVQVHFPVPVRVSVCGHYSLLQSRPDIAAHRFLTPAGFIVARPRSLEPPRGVLVLSVGMFSEEKCHQILMCSLAFFARTRLLTFELALVGFIPVKRNKGAVFFLQRGAN